MQQPPTTTVIIAGPQVGPESTNVTCPSCRAQIRTQVRHEATNRTHLMALLLCLCLCWPCVCVPYCMDSCQNANHYCPGCGAFIGSYTN